MILRLDPPMQVEVVADKHWHGPSGRGMAIYVETSTDLPTFWTIGMDAGGEIWDVPQQYVRLSDNTTWGRIKK